MGTFKGKRRNKVVDIKRWWCLYCKHHNTYDPFTERADYIKKCRDIMNRNPEKIVILKKCECKTKRKIKHHPNYERPFEVELLCFSCHWAAHEKMNPGFNTKQSNGEWNLHIQPDSKIIEPKEASWHYQII